VPIAGQFSRLTRQLRAAVAALFDQDQPFGRLALVHTVFSGATTLVTISLAGSLFFTVSVHESDKRVLLYLLLSLAPFAIVGPLLAPLLDRGAKARRASIGIACGGSAIVALFMARDIASPLLFPEAFTILVLSKLYLVGKAALVPSMTESTDDLASANAKLTMLAALGGFAVSPIGVGILQLGASWVLRFTFLVFVAGAVAAVRLPRTTSLPAPPKPLGAHADGRPLQGPTQPAALPLAEASSGTAAGPAGRPGGLLYRGRAGRAPRPPRVDIKQERRRLGLSMIGPEVTIALGAMTVLRGSFGFLTFFLAFALKNLHSATWWYGVILLASGIGGLIGSMSVPTIRRYLSEQQLLSVALIAAAVVAVITAVLGTLWSQTILSFAVGLSSTAAKPAFDSIAQTYVPPAALGRAFGRFETQLQLAWVLAALIAVVVAFRFAPGDILIAAACGIAAAFHWSMRHSLGSRTTPNPATPRAAR